MQLNHCKGIEYIDDQQHFYIGGPKDMEDHVWFQPFYKIPNIIKIILFRVGLRLFEGVCSLFLLSLPGAYLGFSLIRNSRVLFPCPQYLLSVTLEYTKVSFKKDISEYYFVCSDSHLPGGRKLGKYSKEQNKPTFCLPMMKNQQFSKECGGLLNCCYTLGLQIYKDH